MIEGGLEVKLPTIWTDESRGGKSHRGEAKKWEEQRRERVRRKKMQVREKVRKSLFFQRFVALGGRKVGSLKRRDAVVAWREAHFQAKKLKTPHVRSTFGSSDVEKVHAVVVRSTFPSQNVQNTPFWDHFWKSRWRKSARRCGAKHISKSKV